MPMSPKARLYVVVLSTCTVAALVADVSAADKKASSTTPAKASKKVTEELTALQERVAKLEAEVAELKAALAEVRSVAAKNRPPSEDETKPGSQPKTPGKNQQITDALFQRILKEKLTEDEVMAMLGPGEKSTRAGVPKDTREMVWTEGKNSISIQFVNGRADGGMSTITSNPAAAVRLNSPVTSKSANDSTSAPSSEAELKLPKKAVQPPYCEKVGLALLPEKEYKIVGERLALKDKLFQKAQGGWRAPLEAVLKDKVDTQSLIYFMLTLEPLWGDGKFQAAVSEQYLDRVKQLTGDVIQSWQVEFDDILKPSSSIDKFRTVGVLIQVDALFDDGRITKERSDQLRKRFRSIGQEPRKTWFKVAGGDLCFSMLSLLGNDWLFEQDSFRDDAFQQAMVKVKVPSR